MHSIDDILEKTECMKRNIELSIAEAELVIWYQDNAYKFVPQCYLKYKNLFANNFLSDELTGFGFYLAKEDTLEEFAKIFAKWCGIIDRVGGTAVLDKLDSDVSEANKIFVSLVRQVNIFLKRRVNINWSTEEIANNVLDHMLDYYKNFEWRGEMTVEEDLLDCLMFNCLDGVVCQFEVPI